MTDPIRVLYVDDETDLLEIGKLFLEKGGTIFVDTLTSAKTALEKLNTERYDAIVSDYQMPEIDGIEFLNLVRTRFGNIPFLLFTGKGREEVVIQAINNGVDAYIQKGGDPRSQFAELSLRIRKAVGWVRAEQALHHAHGRLRCFVDANIVGVVVASPSGRIIETNDYYLHLIGFTRVEFEQGKVDWRAITPPEWLPVDEYAINELRERGTSTPYEKEYIRRDGTRISVFLSNAMLPGPEEQIAAFVVDVTERKRIEEALRESEERYRHFFKTTLDSVFITTPEGRWIDFNDALVEMSGYASREEMQGVPVSSLYAHPEERSAFLKIVEHEGYVKEHPIQFKKKDGTVADTLLTIVPQTNPDGSLKAFIGTVRDITERKRAEEPLRESEERYRLINDSSRDFIYSYDRNGRFTSANKSLCDAMGLRADQIIGKTHAELSFPAEQCREWDELHRRVYETGATVDSPTSSLMPDGNVHYHEVTLNPLHDREGNITGIAGTTRDITERKRSEEAVQQANRKITLLSSITLHDINNQLTSLQGYRALLENRLTDPPSVMYIQKIGDAAMRITAMIQFAKAYEAIGVNSPAWQDIRTHVDTATKEALPQKITLKNEIPAGTEVFADPLIAKVFYNLMDNAVRYNGKITTIRFSVEESGDDRIIVCEDDGEGIPAGKKERIFERGYGMNTGLGLTLSREILDITGITIRETGEPGKGARFEIRVPKAAYRVGVARKFTQ
jgi:PAS domain S-box-containing protein